jgi:opacity protein-like surface antigen
MFTGREADEISGTGNVSLSYRYHLNRTFAFGVSAAFENIDVTYEDGGTDRYKTVAVMATARLKYLDRPRLSLYSGAGLGYARFAFGDAVGSGPAFQLTLLGLGWRIAGSLGLHFELGAGYQGLFNIGLFGRF